VRFFGVVGYGESVETAPGVWTEEITEREYYGDVIRSTRQLVPGESVNDDVTVGNRISVLADPFATQNFAKIKYVAWNGENWKVTDVEIQSPRLILSIGSVWNGPTP
jgi:hypothetical protein